jgi:hypothetical protein
VGYLAGKLFSIIISYCALYLVLYFKVVGSIEQTGDTDESKAEKDPDSAFDSKNGAKPMDVDKAKTKRKLYVGQELEFRRDNMKVSCWLAACTQD